MERAQGIDVSHHRYVNDWAKLAGAGLSFLGVKATNGQGTDRQFVGHLAGARAAAFELVVYYHFPTPRSSAVAQADNFVNAVTAGGLRPNERLALDVELYEDLDWCPDIRFVEEFTLEVIRLVDDRRPLIYTSSRVWKMPRFINSATWAKAIGTDLWAPRYGDVEPELPVDAAGLPVWPKWTIWQDSEEYSCPGVSGPCDHNVFRGDVDELRAYAALTT